MPGFQPWKCSSLELRPDGHEDVVLELGVRRRVADDARDLAVLVVDADDLAEGVLDAEILPGDPFREKDGVLALQGVAGVAPEKRDVEDPEEVRAGRGDIRFLEGLVAIDDGLGLEPDPEELGGELHLGILFLERRGERGIVAAHDILALGRLAVEADPVDPVDVLMIRIDAGLEEDVEKDEAAGGDAHGQGQDVDEGIALVLDHPPQGRA